ncbi:hypothetical protein CONLIGDRAFT_665601 [Coniochaeta ligniaria NRRL 30616]|uniref:Uncharacterized protein n=1 Tax=Coniochaeta ligniaria NRRL 30616 TaxID=1408157 RepID=A0A1J7J560_9PEZI|nr:hypothetical protein CONLIGDRAFT_665601 [Coniochaeta ligniaria NRRL 30616]
MENKFATCSNTAWQGSALEETDKKREALKPLNDLRSEVQGKPQDYIPLASNQTTAIDEGGIAEQSLFYAKETNTDDDAQDATPKKQGPQRQFAQLQAILRENVSQDAKVKLQADLHIVAFLSKAVHYRRGTGTGKIIKTGDVIHIRTEDTNKYPLPSVPLLKLQYHLQHCPSTGALVASDDGQQERHTEAQTEDTEPLDQGFCDILILARDTS